MYPNRTAHHHLEQECPYDFQGTVVSESEGSGGPPCLPCEAHSEVEI